MSKAMQDFKNKKYIFKINFFYLTGSHCSVAKKSHVQSAEKNVTLLKLTSSLFLNWRENQKMLDAEAQIL